MWLIVGLLLLASFEFRKLRLAGKTRIRAFFVVFGEVLAALALLTVLWNAFLALVLTPIEYTFPSRVKPLGGMYPIFGLVLFAFVLAILKQSRWQLWYGIAETGIGVWLSWRTAPGTSMGSGTGNGGAAGITLFLASAYLIKRGADNVIDGYKKSTGLKQLFTKIEDTLGPEGLQNNQPVIPKASDHTLGPERVQSSLPAIRKASDNRPRRKSRSGKR
jgi:hypothetical protein